MEAMEWALSIRDELSGDAQAVWDAHAETSISPIHTLLHFAESGHAPGDPRTRCRH